MNENIKQNWIVAIYQQYCVSLEGKLDNETLLIEICVSAKTAQEASNMGWAYIRIGKLENAVVRRVNVESPSRITFEPEDISA